MTSPIPSDTKGCHCTLTLSSQIMKSYRVLSSVQLLSLHSTSAVLHLVPPISSSLGFTAPCSQQMSSHHSGTSTGLSFWPSWIKQLWNLPTTFVYTKFHFLWVEPGVGLPPLSVNFKKTLQLRCRARLLEPGRWCRSTSWWFYSALFVIHISPFDKMSVQVYVHDVCTYRHVHGLPGHEVLTTCVAQSWTWPSSSWLQGTQSHSHVKTLVFTIN